MSPSDKLIQEEPESGLMLAAARLDLYRVNGFRITGLAVDATTQAVTRQVDKLRMAGKYGAGAGVTRTGPLPLEPAPDDALFRSAIQRLRDPEIRLLDEFFWFWPQDPGGGAQDEALSALAHGEEDKAVAVWTDREKQKSDDSFVATHNLAVLLHAKALDLETNPVSGSVISAVGDSAQISFWSGALQRWQILWGREDFWNRLKARINEIRDPRLTVATAQRMREALPLTVLLINAQLAVRAAQAQDITKAQRQVELMKKSGFNEETIHKALRREVEPIRQLIKTVCETAGNDTDADPLQADGVTCRLLDQSTPLLAVFDSLFPPGDATRDGVHDEVALRALTCQVAFGNKTDNWRTSVEPLERALLIAVSESARTRVEENLKVVRDNKTLGTCFFCQELPAEASREASVPMHGNVQTAYAGYNQTRTTWNHNTFKIPRCADCARAHQKVASVRIAGQFLALLSIVIFFVSLGFFDSLGWWDGYDGSPAWFLILGGFIAFISPLYLWRALGRGVLKGRAAEEKKYVFATVLDRKRQGWRLGLNPQPQGATREIPKYRANRGKWLGDWPPFSRWAARKWPVFASMTILWIPCLLVRLVPVLRSALLRSSSRASAPQTTPTVAAELPQDLATALRVAQSTARNLTEIDKPHVSPVSRTEAVRTLINGTQYTVRAVLAGPSLREMLIPPGVTASVDVPAGTYRVFLRVVVARTGDETFYGEQSYDSGSEYTSYLRLTACV